MPAGMEYQLVPDADYSFYMYFASDPAIGLTHARLARLLPSKISDAVSVPLSSDADVEASVGISRGSVIVSAFGEYASTLEFADEADAQTAFELLQRTSAEGSSPQNKYLARMGPNSLHLAYGESHWADGVSRQYEAATLIPFPERDPEAWSLLTNLPISEDAAPLAAGIVVMDHDLIDSLTELLASIDEQQLGKVFGMVRVEKLAFAVYGKPPALIPNEVGTKFIDEHHATLVMVSSTGYPGIGVAFLLRSIAGELGMETIDLGNTNARYAQLDYGHLILKNKGSLVYTVLASDRALAENMMLRALAKSKK